MKRTFSNLFLAVACAGAFFAACSDDEVAGGAVEDHDIIAGKDTVFIHDSVFVNDTVKVVKRDTITEVERDTVTKVERDTLEVLVKDSSEIYKGPVSGVSQKGPFVKGSNVKVFELDGTNKLLQTGRSYSGSVSLDDGSFSVKNVSLVSSHVYLTVTGAFRKEVDGGKTKNAITLRALSDLDESRTTVNVNLVTHLEYDRVAYLLENNPKMTLSEAKKQAEKEIFALFSIDAGKFGLAENLDIFGAGEASAALLAVSVMLPADLDESGITARLSRMGADLAEDGKIDDAKLLDSIALWAMSLDLGGGLAGIRNNIVSWGFGDNVPDFEKFVRKFWSVQLGVGECGSGEYPAGTIMPANAKIFAASAYGGIVFKDSSTRYMCVDSSGVGFAWRFAGAFEEDTLGLGRGFKEGDIHAGLVNEDRMYVFDNGGFRPVKSREVLLGKGCTSGIELDTLSYGYTHFNCKNGEWKVRSSDEGFVEDAADAKKHYKTVGIGKQMWMAENVDLDVSMMISSSSTNDSLLDACGGADENGNRKIGDCEKYGRLYTWFAAQFVCPDGFRLPADDDWRTLIDFVGGKDSAGVALLASGEFGFNAVLAGIRLAGGDSTLNVGQETGFWSSTGFGKNEARFVYLNSSSAESLFFKGDKREYLSVRCVKE